MSNAKLSELKAQIAKLREDAQAEAKAVFYEGAKQAFNKHPELKAYRWTQYTPYFNDGDACVFNSHHEYPELEFNGDGKVGDFKDGYDSKEHKEVYEAVHTFLQQFEDDDFEAMFGDHVQVTVTADGVKVDEYDHD